jgi:hypothetical protein
MSMMLSVRLLHRQLLFPVRSPRKAIRIRRRGRLDAAQVLLAACGQQGDSVGRTAS